MLHELVFLGCHSQFASYPYTFALHSYSCKILQPYVAATIGTHSDALCRYQFDRLPSPPRANRRATNFFRQNQHPGDSFLVQKSGPRVEKMKQNPHPRA